MKFGFIGAQCSGKSTVVSNTFQHLKCNGIVDVMIRSEAARRCPYPINKSYGLKTQFWITSEAIRKELELEKKCEHLLCDRTVVDQVVYAYDALKSGRLSTPEFEFILEISKRWLTVRPYDVTYFLGPAKLYADSVRPFNLDWQKTIYKYFEYWTPRLLGRWGYIEVMHPDIEKLKRMVALDVVAKIRNPPCSVLGR